MLRHVAVKDARFGAFTFMRASALYLRGRSQSRDSTNGKRTRTRTRGAMESDLAAPTEAVAVAPEPIAGVKRPLEEPSAPEGSPPAADAAPASEAAPVAIGAPPVAAPPVATPTSQEEAALQGEAAWLRQQIATLQPQLAGLQQQHAHLTATAQAAAAAAAAQQQQHQQHQQQQQQQQQQQMQAQAAPAATQGLVHNQAWTEQVNAENGQTYYWNSQTSESTYTRPHDFNPGAATASMSVTNTLPQTKGPPGANLFVVRKMRRGEYDEFNDEDLRREFDKHGVSAASHRLLLMLCRISRHCPSPRNSRKSSPLCPVRGLQVVTRAEMTIDKENGWSKGFGFVSFGTVEEADAAVEAIHGSWISGREMKVEKTHE